MKIVNSDCLEYLKQMPDNSIDAIVTDPPYGLSFMGKKWDYDVPSQEIWEECLRVLKPGGYLLSFAGTRTQHRMAVRIEDAGFEIRDMIAWVYGSGFPKSLNIGKAVDKTGGQQVGWFGKWLREWRETNSITQKEIAKLFPSKTGGLTGCVANWELGFNMPTNEQFNLICKTFNLPFKTLQEAEREFIGKHETDMGGLGGERLGQKGGDITKGTSEWEGWGTALKPALEPITVARKPIEGNVAQNCLKWGVGGINIDGCRVEAEPELQKNWTDRKAPAGFNGDKTGIYGSGKTNTPSDYTPTGRFPANLIHDGSDEVVGLFPNSKSTTGKRGGQGFHNAFGRPDRERKDGDILSGHNDSGSAARFFYCAKASKSERNRGCEELEEKGIAQGNSTLMHNPKMVRCKECGKRPPTAGCDNTCKCENPEYEWYKQTNNHPTVKPIALMEYLVKLVSKEGHTVLDPFMGSGSTGIACKKLGREFIGIEKESDYCKIAEARIGAVQSVQEELI